jgi:pimeloyl-ACP methyl ester carboxylesterase
MPRSSIVSRIAHDKVSQFPRPISMGTRWWETLPKDFSEQEERFSLALRDALPVRAGAAADVVVRTIGACLVGGLAMPLGYRPKLLAEAFDDLKFYGPMAESGDPTRFFAKPPRGIPVQTRTARLPLNRPKDGLCEDLRFASPYVPVNPRLRDSYLSNARNRRAHVRLWRHSDGPRPMVIAVHGFSADLYHLNEWFFALPWLYAVGCDVALFTLPFHGKRQSRLSPFSGHGFFAGGASHINEAFGQAICDLRVLIDHLIEERGVPRVGITGVSLGGFTSALLAAVDSRLSFAVPNVPVTSLPDLVLEWQPIGTILRGALAATGRSIVDVRHLLSVSSPLTYRPLIGRERLMVIGGVGDRLAPPKHTKLLWEHWERCRLHWFPGNHLIHLDRGAYLREMGKFLGGLGFFEGLPARAAE